MIPPELLLVIPVKLVDRMPLPPLTSQPRRGRPRYYSDRLFMKALIIMIVRHLHKVHELLTVLDEPTAEMQALRALLTEGGRYPTRRTSRGRDLDSVGRRPRRRPTGRITNWPGPCWPNYPPKSVS